jgi:hypothetical protein
MNPGSFWKNPWHLLGRSPEMTCQHDPDKDDRPKSAFVLGDWISRRPSQHTDSSEKKIFKFNILWQCRCSQFAQELLFRSAPEDAENLDNASGQRTDPQFEMPLRNTRGNWRHESAACSLWP